MNWDQIENNWAAMTRRVRADWVADRDDAKTPLARSITRIDVTIPDRQTGIVVDASPKISAE